MAAYINKVVVPSRDEVEEGSLFAERITWVNGKYTRLDMGDVVALYIGHEEVSTLDENGEEKTKTVALEVLVSKPLTRPKAIDAAERTIFCLKNADEVASYNAGLSRKFRMNPEDEEVKQHDKIINDVRQWLTECKVY